MDDERMKKLGEAAARWREGRVIDDEIRRAIAEAVNERLSGAAIVDIVRPVVEHEVGRHPGIVSSDRVSRDLTALSRAMIDLCHSLREAHEAIGKYFPDDIVGPHDW